MAAKTGGHIHESGIAIDRWVGCGHWVGVTWLERGHPVDVGMGRTWPPVG